MLRVITDIIPEYFNSFVEHPLQSYAWGEARKETGIEVVRFGWFDGETLKSVYQMTVHRLPHTPYAIGYLPAIALPPDPVCRALKVYASRRRIIMIQMDVMMNAPGIKRSAPVSPLLVSSEGMLAHWTQLLDLSPSEETLLANCSRTTRYDINMTRRAGVISAIDDTEEGFEIFAELYFATSKRQGYFGHSMQYHRAVWRSMHKAGIAHLLIARYRGKPLGAIEVFIFKDTLYYLYAGSSMEHRDLNAMKALLFEAIRFGKSRGAKTFDMWGSLPPLYKKDHPWAGFTEFKRSFGTRLVEQFESYDLVARPFLYRFYTVSYALRKRLLPLLRRAKMLR